LLVLLLLYRAVTHPRLRALRRVETMLVESMLTILVSVCLYRHLGCKKCVLISDPHRDSTIRGQEALRTLRDLFMKL
jgi:hypothetical protein